MGVAVISQCSGEVDIVKSCQEVIDIVVSSLGLVDTVASCLEVVDTIVSCPGLMDIVTSLEEVNQFLEALKDITFTISQLKVILSENIDSFMAFDLMHMDQQLVVVDNYFIVVNKITFQQVHHQVAQSKDITSPANTTITQGYDLEAIQAVYDVKSSESISFAFPATQLS